MRTILTLALLMIVACQDKRTSPSVQADRPVSSARSSAPASAVTTAPPASTSAMASASASAPAGLSATEACTSAVFDDVASTAPAKKFLAQTITPAQSAEGLSGFGGMVQPPESGDTTYRVSLNENHTDRVMVAMWFEVDPKTGDVKQLDMASMTGIGVAADAKRRAAVVAACK